VVRPVTIAQMVELVRAGLGIRQELLELGCPENEATEWTAKVIAWVVENRRQRQAAAAKAQKRPRLRAGAEVTR
jgi:hypothetical protein